MFENAPVGRAKPEMFDRRSCPEPFHRHTHDGTRDASAVVMRVEQILMIGHRSPSEGPTG